MVNNEFSTSSMGSVPKSTCFIPVFFHNKIIAKKLGIFEGAIVIFLKKNHRVLDTSAPSTKTFFLSLVYCFVGSKSEKEDTRNFGGREKKTRKSLLFPLCKGDSLWCYSEKDIKLTTFFETLFKKAQKPSFIIKHT